MPLLHDNVVFILVRPVFLGNIGATARVMKNFGFHQLRLVEPPRNYKDSEARRMSVGAFDVLKQAEVFPALQDALQDVSLAAGTTSARQREITPLNVQDVSPKIVEAAANNRVALVFGDERDGLTRQELERCHLTVTIPTVAAFAALNLSQAAGIFAYELVRNHSSPAPQGEVFPDGALDDSLCLQLGELLDAISFSRTFNRENVLSELRQLYQRAHPSMREYDLLKGILHRLNHSLIHKG